jgi:5-methylcytosine-specific restriction endonuclease McrA
MSGRKFVSRTTRAIMLTRDGRKCVYCKVDVFTDVSTCHPQYATIDHKTPKSRGGSNRLRNVVTACASCNTDKADLNQAEYEWLKRMRRKGFSDAELRLAIATVRKEGGNEIRTPKRTS